MSEYDYAIHTLEAELAKCRRWIGYWKARNIEAQIQWWHDNITQLESAIRRLRGWGK